MRTAPVSSTASVIDLEALCGPLWDVLGEHLNVSPLHVNATQSLAGLPVRSIAQAGDHMMLDKMPVLPPGNKVLAGNAPDEFLMSVARRLGIEHVAGVSLERRFGRLTGEVHLPWEGPCGRPVCLGLVAQALKRAATGPVRIMGTSCC